MPELAEVIPISGAETRRAPRRAKVHLTADELLRVLKTAKERSPRDHAMILLSYTHGLRASEVCGLTLSDVNVKDGTITVQRLKGSLRTVQPLREHRGQPLLDEPKALKAWLRVRPADGSDALFTSRQGGALTRIQFYRIFQAVAEAAGLPAEKCHPHVLKHSLATHLIGVNTNIAFVKQSLGHRALSSTMAYVTVTDSQAADAVAAAMMRLF